jgi:hypothetical protein
MLSKLSTPKDWAMRPPKNSIKILKVRTYVLVDGKYSYLGSNSYQRSDIGEEYLEKYIRQRKEAKHITISIAISSGSKAYI